MNSSAASATTSDGEAFQRFLQENHDELCLGLASEKVADLLEWLKTYEVLSAVECEVIVASGPSHQAETLLKFLSTRDARDHWKPFWNGIGRCAPQLHAKWIPVIYAKLGDTGLTGEFLRVQFASFLWHGYNKFSVNERKTCVIDTWYGVSISAVVIA